MYSVLYEIQSLLYYNIHFTVYNIYYTVYNVHCTAGGRQPFVVGDPKNQKIPIAFW